MWREWIPPSTAMASSSKRASPLRGCCMVKRVCPRSHPDTCPGVILLKGNRAPKEEVWGGLNLTGIHSGRKHFIFGAPTELITKDFMKEKYLKYQQVAKVILHNFNSRGAREPTLKTTKTQVLESLTKMHGTDSSSFPSQYEGALHDEESPSQDFRQGCLSFHGHFQFLAACPTVGKSGSVSSCTVWRGGSCPQNLGLRWNWKEHSIYASLFLFHMCNLQFIYLFLTYLLMK